MKRESKHRTESAETLPIDLLLLYPLIRRKLLRTDSFLKAHRLSLSHLAVLALLQDGLPATVSGLAVRLGIAKPNITPLLDRLVLEGLVSRGHSEKDRRRVSVALLPAGQALLGEFQAACSESVRQQTARLTPSDFASLVRSVQKLRSCLERL